MINHAKLQISKREMVKMRCLNARMGRRSTYMMVKQYNLMAYRYNEFVLSD